MSVRSQTLFLPKPPPSEERPIVSRKIFFPEKKEQIVQLNFDNVKMEKKQTKQNKGSNTNDTENRPVSHANQ